MHNSVVSLKRARIYLTIAALNDLDILAGDMEIKNLTAPCREKVQTGEFPEFGSLEDEIFIIVKALYDLISSTATFRARLAKKLDDMGFKSSIVDHDVWLRIPSRPDGGEHYE